MSKSIKELLKSVWQRCDSYKDGLGSNECTKLATHTISYVLDRKKNVGEIKGLTVDVPCKEIQGYYCEKCIEFYSVFFQDSVIGPRKLEIKEIKEFIEAKEYLNKI